MNRRFGVLAALAGFVLLLCATPADARREAAILSPDSASVLVALVDDLDGGPAVTAVIVRHAGAEPRDMILLRRTSASGPHLAAAVAMLMHHRSGTPRVARDTRVRIQGAAVPAAWRANWLPRFESLTARLQRAEGRVVPGIGTGPAETVVLPPAAATR
jgi:hypothetical protein